MVPVLLSMHETYLQTQNTVLSSSFLELCVLSCYGFSKCPSKVYVLNLIPAGAVWEVLWAVRMWGLWEVLRSLEVCSWRGLWNANLFLSRILFSGSYGEWFALLHAPAVMCHPGEWLKALGLLSFGLKTPNCEPK